MTVEIVVYRRGFSTPGVGKRLGQRVATSVSEVIYTRLQKVKITLSADVSTHWSTTI